MPFTKFIPSQYLQMALARCVGYYTIYVIEIKTPFTLHFVGVSSHTEL